MHPQNSDFGLPGFFGMDLDMTALGDEEVFGIREKLVELYESEQLWSKATQMLSGIDPDSGRRPEVERLTDIMRIPKQINKITRLAVHPKETIGYLGFQNETRSIVFFTPGKTRHDTKTRHEIDTKLAEYTLKLLDFLSSFPKSNTDPVLQIVGALLLPSTPIHVRSESRFEAPKSLLADLTTHTPVPAYTKTLLEL
ncbi:hypothetical protein LXL04_033989 [Taraxacum kok-saghyz]